MWTAQRSTWVRAGVLVLLLVAGLAVALGADLPDVADIRHWLDGAGAAGWAGITLALALVLLAPVPRSALSVVAGVVAGFVGGLAVALIGAMVAGLVAFGLSRWLGRPAASRLAGERLVRADRLLSERGFLSVLTGRLMPIVPFSLLNYTAGLSGVRLLPYTAATAIGLVPSTIVQVGLGSSAAFIAGRGGTAATTLTVLLAVLATIGAAVLTWRTRGARADEA